jgi:hypothetical protein
MAPCTNPCSVICWPTKALGFFAKYPTLNDALEPVVDVSATPVDPVNPASAARDGVVTRAFRTMTLAIDAGLLSTEAAASSTASAGRVQAT